MMQLKVMCAEGGHRGSVAGAGVGQVELRASLRVRVAVSHGRASARAGVLRAREVWVRMDMCGVFCCG
eukprot:732349-Prymnesium_polylepis.1